MPSKLLAKSVTQMYGIALNLTIIPIHTCRRKSRTREATNARARIFLNVAVGYAARNALDTSRASAPGYSTCRYRPRQKDHDYVGDMLYERGRVPLDSDSTMSVFGTFVAKIEHTLVVQMTALIYKETIICG